MIASLKVKVKVMKISFTRRKCYDTILKKCFDKKFKKRPMSTFSVDHELSRKILNYDINFVFSGVEKTIYVVNSLV